jgi:beta-galactosidase GanA
MRSHGMNTVKYLASWSWIHRAPGSFAFDELDELMDLAHANGLAVVLNVMLENAPYWLEHQVGHARYHDHEGRPFPLTAAVNTPAGGWPGLCFDNAEPRAEATAFLRATAERYRGHPALSVWDIWNEPHLEPTWRHPERQYCYCDASLTEFRRWLRTRYETIERLNDSWQRRYSDWAEVSPPRERETYPDHLDWREFWLLNLQGWLAWKADIVRSVDDGHPLMTHVASSAYLGALTSNVWDEWLLADPVDLFGTSSFPGWLYDDDPALHLFHLEMTRDAARGRPFWQAELQGGRGRREGRESTPHPDPASIESWIWHDILVGAKGVMFWQWRPELLGPESPGYGLCSPDGSPTARTQVISRMATTLAGFPELGDSRPVAPDVAILVSRKTPLLAEASEGSMDLYARSLLGVYRAFLERNVSIQFAHEDHLEQEGVTPTIKALYWPMPSYASGQLADALVRYVETGGLLIAEASPAAYVGGGAYSPRVPAHGLDRLFGGRVIDSDVGDSTIAANGQIVVGAWARDQLIVAGAEIVGRFDDGSPAILRNQFGAGVAYLVGTYPSLAFEDTLDPGTGDWIVATTLGRARIEAMPLLVREHVLDGRRILVVVNRTDKAVERTLPGSGRLVRQSGGVAAADGMLTVSLKARTGAVAVLAES